MKDLTYFISSIKFLFLASSSLLMLFKIYIYSFKEIDEQLYMYLSFEQFSHSATFGLSQVLLLFLTIWDYAFWLH